MLISGLIPAEVRAKVPYLIPFGVLGLWRWGLYVVRIACWLLYRPVQPKHGNSYNGQDVTIIIPTIDTDSEFMLAAQSWLVNEPFEIIVVTTDETQEKMKEFTRNIFAPKSETTKFRVLSVPKANKRVQLMKGVSAARTPIVALSDDDAVWTPNLLQWLLAPFDDPKMGGVGSRQEMMPVGEHASFWEVIADFRLTMRMIEASATTFVDGGISCLSGRTALYRREILADVDFGHQFVNEKWLGKHRLHSGDDKFLTRWIVRTGWKMRLQNHPDATIVTTFKDNALFLKQVLRWTRNTWRSDIKSIFFERRVWTRYPYVAFCMLDKFINPLPVMYSIFVIVFNMAIRSNVLHVVVPVFAWVVLTRILRLLPHLIRKPNHIAHVPVMVAFQYCFPFLKLYALFTLHITDWGSRTSGVETEDFKSGVWQRDLGDDGESTDSTSFADSLDIQYESKKWSSKRKCRRVITLLFGWFLLMLSLISVGVLFYFTYDSFVGSLGRGNDGVLPIASRWMNVGYRGTGQLPSATEISTTEGCVITAVELQRPPYNVIPDDSVDDSLGLQTAIDDIGIVCQGSFEQLALIELPSGTIDITREIRVDVDFLVIRGQGTDAEGTTVEFRPGNVTKYDTNVASTFSGNEDDNSTGGWITPGRGAFRVQTREVHLDYAEAYRTASPNRRDFFEGSVNFPWKAGIHLRRNAVEGDSVLYLKQVDRFEVGTVVWIGASNTNSMYDRQDFPPIGRRCGYMRQQIFVVRGIHVGSRSILLDKPLEFDVPVDHTADGSLPLPCGGSSSASKSKAMPLHVVRGVGFEDFTLTQIVEGLDPIDVHHNYNNVVPKEAMHGIVFKWSTDSFVRNVQMVMVGSHSIATEQCKNMQFESNVMNGSWNKGKGGNGYFRISKLWDSLIVKNTLTGLRRLTLQWSASGNVLQDNVLDCDINLHGGWERYNLIERNNVSIPLDFSKSGSFYPIFWASGAEARWAGATGARNVFFHNKLTMEKGDDGDNSVGGYYPYAPYGNHPNTVFQFGWDRRTPEGSAWEPMRVNGVDSIELWRFNEEVPFYLDPHVGVNSNCQHSGTSLVGVDFTKQCSSSSARKGNDCDHTHAECTTLRQCQTMYGVGATACADHNNGRGGVCYCGDDLCGCTDASPPAASIPSPSLRVPAAPTYVPTELLLSTTTAPSTATSTTPCGAPTYQSECTLTAECQQTYPGVATDCWNAGGGVCLCGESRVCGCL